MKFKNFDFLKAQEGSVKDKNGNHVSYLDGGGVWTIGYGHTGREVRRGQSITEEEAIELFDKDIDWAEDAVNNALLGYELTQNQFDALVSLTYNIGASGFKNSTVVKRIKSGDYKGAAEAITWWNKDNGKVVKGLVSRRAREKELFLRPDEPTLPLPSPDEKKIREQKIRSLIDKFVKDLMEI